MHKKILLPGILLLASLVISTSFADTPVSNNSVFADNTVGKITGENNDNIPLKNSRNNIRHQKIYSSQKNNILSQTVINTPPPAPPVLNVHGYYLEEVNSGKVLGTQNPDQKMPPASLTKLMTLYITFEALEANRVHLTDLVPISETAWKTGGSRMFVKVGDKVPLSDLLNGVIVDSGNDACVALAEYIGGTEQSFTQLMNQQAGLLGMKNTHYMDATGLPNPDHYTTPHDLAILARAIIVNFPQYYPLFAQKTFTFNNITQPNRNRLLWANIGVDGLKTGHTEAAGFCLIASAKHKDMRLLSVVLGAPTNRERAEYSESLLNYGFRFYETHKVYTKNQIIKTMPVYFGQKQNIPVGIAQDFYLTLPRGQYDQINISFDLPAFLKAPVQQYQKIGSVRMTLGNKDIISNPNIDIIALEEVSKGNIFRRLWDELRLLFHKI